MRYQLNNISSFQLLQLTRIADATRIEIFGNKPPKRNGKKGAKLLGQMRHQMVHGREWY